MEGESVRIISGVCLHPTIPVNFLSTNLYIHLYGMEDGRKTTQIQAS